MREKVSRRAAAARTPHCVWGLYLARPRWALICLFFCPFLYFFSQGRRRSTQKYKDIQIHNASFLLLLFRVWEKSFVLAALGLCLSPRRASTPACIASDGEPVHRHHALDGLTLPQHSVFAIHRSVPQCSARRVHPAPRLLHEVARHCEREAVRGNGGGGGNDEIRVSVSRFRKPNCGSGFERDGALGI